MVLLIIIPIKWLFHWGYTQHFQTNPCVVALASTRVGQFSWFGLSKPRSEMGGFGRLHVPIDMLVSHVKLMETYREQWVYDRNTFWQVLDINIVVIRRCFLSNSSRNGILSFLLGCVQLLIPFW